MKKSFILTKLEQFFIIVQDIRREVIDWSDAV
jgi:hypothetical protein